MNDANSINQRVSVGPSLRVEKALGWVQSDDPRVARRALYGVLVSWMPLALLATAQTILFSDGSARSFYSDLSVHARYLIAVPALIVAEVDCIPRFEAIIRHFVDIGLITPTDLPRYQSAETSTRRLLQSRFGELIVVLISYLSVAPLFFYLSADIVPRWQQGSVAHFSPAGWWHALVSLPLLVILLVRWLWRLILWGRFLLTVARLDLQLLPSHPDRVGGLRFVSTSLRGFRLISFGLGAIAAGSVAERVLKEGADLMKFRPLVIALVAFVVVLSAAPLFVFRPKLRSVKKRGMFAYGALALQLGRHFESKWLGSSTHQGNLEVPDFSATTDLYSIVANTYDMHDVPFKMKDLIAPVVVPVLIPFGAVALMTIPLRVVVDALMKMLF